MVRGRKGEIGDAGNEGNQSLATIISDFDYAFEMLVCIVTPKILA